MKFDYKYLNVYLHQLTDSIKYFKPTYLVAA